jgi:hypothetical protein
MGFVSQRTQLEFSMASFAIGETYGARCETTSYKLCMVDDRSIPMRCLFQVRTGFPMHPQWTCASDIIYYSYLYSTPYTKTGLSY